MSRTDYAPTRTFYEAALQEWVRTALDSFKDSTPKFPVQWTHQPRMGQTHGPLHPAPCATLQILSLENIGQQEAITTDVVVGSHPVTGDDRFEFNVVTHYRGTVSITVIGRQHRQMTSTLRASVKMASVQLLNHSNNLAIWDELAAIDAPAQAGVESEPRSVLDFSFGIATRHSEPVDVIETVEPEVIIS